MAFKLCAKSESTGSALTHLQTVSNDLTRATGLVVPFS
jgi:hypothetical protein